MPDRPLVPQSIADNLMFENDHTCCICRTRGKHVQIHHIDDDNLNNSSSNLAILCLECHSKVTGTEGLGRKYTPGEVRKYKRSWEHISKERLTGQPPKPTKTYEGLSFFEITVSEILSMEDGDPRIAEKLQTFWELSTMTGCIDEILDSLFYLTVSCSISMKQTSIILSDIIYKLFFHFVGPDEVSLDAYDKKRLIQAIEHLGTIGHFNAEFSKDLQVIQTVANNLYNFYEIASLYDLSDVISLINSKLQLIKESCVITFSDLKEPFGLGAEYIDQIMEQTQKLG